MKVTVIYPQRATFFVNVPDEHSKSHRDALAYVWEACQNGIEEITKKESFTDMANRVYKAKLRSSMIGDVMIVEDRFYMVNNFGFTGITESQFLVLQSIEDRDRLMGWNWLKERNLIEGEPISVVN